MLCECWKEGQYLCCAVFHVVCCVGVVRERFILCCFCVVCFVSSCVAKWREGEREGEKCVV